MSINQILNNELFETYQQISFQINSIQGNSSSIEEKKALMKKLRQQYENKLVTYNKIANEFANLFMKKEKLDDHIITARIGSPTYYGNQPKDYLWSGISIDNDKSFSFQYSWVFQKGVFEVTFCFGSGGTSSGKIENWKKEEKEQRMRLMERKFLEILENNSYREIIEKLLQQEGFVLTAEWLNTSSQSISNMDEFLNRIREKTGAKSGITRYFKQEELLGAEFNLEEKIFRYFDIFRPVWDKMQEIKNGIDYSEIESSGSEEYDYLFTPLVDELTVIERITTIKNFIAGKGFMYPNHWIENFFLSLKAKPFVILAGVSGTGKTKLVKLFAEAVGATASNGQFSLIPVRPDWSDPSDLLGYKDLSGAFRPGKLTEVLVEASKPENQHKPYFICLDEMNLARVEHYFSDLLSVLETQEWDNQRIVTTPLIHKDSLQNESDKEVYGNLHLPDNVYIVGTVNMDETTHPFSKKVLDRANTIEFNYIDLGQYPSIETELADGATALPPNALLRSEYLQLVDVYRDYKQLTEETTELLVKINGILEQIHSHVGFRIRDAVCFYMIYNERFALLSKEAAFDMQLLQKILPRIQGSSSSVKKALLQLMQVTQDRSLPISEYMEDASKLYLSMETLAAAKYPQSARKIAFMLRRLEEDGFTSYWLS
ncbi:AAA family ATPase [Paenibacillus sp. HWE-109]|uniref:McrB family protein n=1 Tax=Paenibacillus sp. HWE-109 TaxID=1306526 RepID=UPI001EDF7031|nr:AAA family ATPase [Paenibacillus sp. HWE-109]UKS26635.1 AAA family ATPase [Paenibacillus sp. HWE-109]